MRNRLRLIMLGVFCAGVLLTGIGVGIAIVEYTSLEYTGVHMIGGEATESDYEFTVELEEDEKLLVMNHRGMVEILYDKTVPVNTIQCSILHNPDFTRMIVGIEDAHERTGEATYNNTWLYIYERYVGSDFDLLMQNKDSILADLKEGKIGTYMVEDSVKSITVRVNPEMKESVMLSGR